MEVVPARRMALESEQECTSGPDWGRHRATESAPVFFWEVFLPVQEWVPGCTWGQDLARHKGLASVTGLAPAFFLGGVIPAPEWVPECTWGQGSARRKGLASVTELGPVLFS